EAIDKWFEDLSHYEQTLEEMAVVSLDTVFKDELSTIESWFRVLSEAERTAALYSLLQHFFQRAHLIDPVQSQLHGAMVKAEMEASQRLLNVLPIQPPAPIERPGVQRRLYDRHSVTIGESDEYSRLFRRDGKRNSIDFLGRTTTNTNNSSNINHNNSMNGGTNTNGSPNGHVNGVIGSSALSETISARVNQYKPTQGSMNRISTPNMFGNRPKSVHEGDTSSMFSSNWNFATLGANPVNNNNGPNNVSNSSTSPGNIGDRTSFGRPKSVGGAEWMLSGSSNHRIPATEGLEKPWTPLMMSPPNMGGFHNGTNGSGHNLSAGGFSNSGLAVERPKSVTEADLNVSQWVHNNNLNNNINGTNGQRTSTLEELKANNRRRTLLRPSAIISNVPVTVMEGDEKLLSASANTSSINIVSTMFNETSGTGSGSGPMSDLTTSGAATSSASQGNASVFSYAGSQPSLNSFSQQQQQAVQQLQNLSLDPNINARSSQQQQQQQQQYHQQQHHHTQQPSQPRSRASSPFASPLPSPIKSGFRSRPVSGPTSPRLPAQNSAWTNGGSNNGNNINMNSHGPMDINMIVPMDYNQKRHLSPPNNQRSQIHHSSLDDDYLSDTSDISSIGMNGHHGRGGSSVKEKKQPEGVDFELLQDTPAWLRSLRLHKYNSIFEGMQWRDIVNLSDGDLINKGVAALGARRKMLKVFEQVRKEMLLQSKLN
ncbi:hypothetical protein BGZ80_002631, partial [Entomortierella chlamydospora]